MFTFTLTHEDIRGLLSLIHRDKKSIDQPRRSGEIWRDLERLFFWSLRMQWEKKLTKNI